MQQVAQLLLRKDFDEDWSFSDVRRKDIVRLTHSYHRYPSKYIPQLVNRLISEHSQPDDIVLDPFVGGGTTLVEGMILDRRVVGIDVNPIACLISRVKTTPI